NMSHKCDTVSVDCRAAQPLQGRVLRHNDRDRSYWGEGGMIALQIHNVKAGRIICIVVVDPDVSIVVTYDTMGTGPRVDGPYELESVRGIHLLILLLGVSRQR